MALLSHWLLTLLGSSPNATAQVAIFCWQCEQFDEKAFFLVHLLTFTTNVIQGCSNTLEVLSRVIFCFRLGNCNYVECNYGQWSQWSTTCGRGERKRNMQQIRKTTQRVDCSGLPQTCSNTPNVQTRNQKCMLGFWWNTNPLSSRGSGHSPRGNLRACVEGTFSVCCVVTVNCDITWPKIGFELHQHNNRF